MIRSLWMLGAVLLFACGVESSPQATPSASFASESAASSELASPASAAQSPGVAQSAAVCTPGTSQFCCPYPQGCTCPGEQFCEDDGTWDECYGPSPAPGPCL